MSILIQVFPDMGEVCFGLARPIGLDIQVYSDLYLSILTMQDQSDIYTITEIGLSMTSEPQ